MTDTTQQPDTPTTLAELYELSDGGKAEWWPKSRHGYPMIFMQLGHLTLSLPGSLYWVDEAGGEYWRTFTLDIIRGNAERWLIDERGWTMYRSEGWIKYCPPITGQYYPLAAALRAETNRETGTTT